MKRRLLNLLTVLSLLLCVAACVMWVRSHWVSDHLVYCRVTAGTWLTEWRLWSGRGNVALFVRGGTFPLGYDLIGGVLVPGPPVGWQATRWAPEDPAAGMWPGSVSAGGFGLESSGPNGPHRYRRGVSVPLWAVAATAAVPPALRLHRRLRRRPQGFCPSCGYDLRATPGRCPECGMTASVSTTK